MTQLTTVSAVVVAFALAVGPASAAAQLNASDPVDGWEVESGSRLEVDAGNFMLPASMAFVPDPGPNPDDPLYFVAELRGTIKVVTRDRSVHVFATDVTNFRPPVEFPAGGSDAEAGLAGICLAPDEGYVFVTFAHREDGWLRNRISRFSSVPGTFGLEAGERVDLPLLDEFEGGISHQIGGCTIHDGMLHVGVGDGWQPYRTGDPSQPNGKLLRMDLDGGPVPENPFYSERQSGVSGHVYAVGLRNPFGVALIGDRVFVADNGTRIDRFLYIEPGKDYLWRGSDNSIALGADFVFSPSIGPAQLAYASSDHPILPERLRETFYLAASANRGGLRPGVMALEWKAGSENLSELPRWIVRARHTEQQVVAAVAVGPDGIYFAPLFPLGAEGSPVLKVVPDGESDGNGGVVTSSPRFLMVERGCAGCHVLDNDYGFGSNVGPPLNAQDGSLTARLREYLNSEGYVQSLQGLDTSDSLHAYWADARREVLEVSGDERVRLWIKYRIMEPRFDRVASAMPNLQVPEHEAEVMAAHLSTPVKHSFLTRAVSLVAPSDGIGRKRMLILFAIGVSGGSLLTVGVGGLVLRKRRVSGRSSGIDAD